MVLTLDKAYLSERIPRCTSYPTAPLFTPEVGAAAYRSWLAQLDGEQSGSIYLHIPFCPSLCWYCGCHTKIASHYGIIDRYGHALMDEIATVADYLPRILPIGHLHWGGGTPTIAGADLIRRVMTL